MKKVLISGYYGFDNFGDEAVLGILLDKLKDCYVTVLTSDPQKTFNTHGVHCVYSFSQKVIKEIADCDILISGGGSLLQNATSNASLMYYSSIIKMAQIFKKKVIIFAQGIGPISGFWSNFFTKRLLKKCDYISVRDEESLKLLKSWKIDAKLVCDPVFNLPAKQITHTSKIGIQLRKYDTLTDNLFDNIVSQVKSRYYSKEIELISFEDNMDIGISEVFMNKLKYVDPKIKVKIVKGLSQEEKINRIASLDCLIGMRFHACLIAIKHGVKTLAINYDPKVENLAKSAGIPILEMDNKKNDYYKAFDDMENLSRWNLMDWSKSQQFGWANTGINEVIK